MNQLDAATQAFSDFAWGMPLLILLIGGGLFFLFYSNLIPYRYLGHAIGILRGKYDDPNDPGDIDHYEALSTALASTIGMGNISGVAVAIATGGPGALFWMWMTAIVGMATKFFTCTLAIMYRGKDSKGDVQGGPMYFITEGLGKKWKPMATFFSVAALVGALPIFNANQFTQTLTDVLLVPAGFSDSFGTKFVIGIFITILVSLVIFGGIKRIGGVAGKLVPVMVVLYSAMVIYILLINASQVPDAFALIFEDAFSGSAVLGGALGEIIRSGVKRGAFSNEAGIGTAPMAHGAAKTAQPIREGLIAMMGPAIDTLIVCTMTALAIIITGVWEEGGSQGISLTLKAFESAMPGVGSYLLMICVSIFALSSLFTFSYYGTKSLGFLIGAEKQHYYNYFYVASICFGAAVSITSVINIIDGAYALMAFPTMIAAILMAPRVKAAAKEYFDSMQKA
ncbi:MAG: alanine/glycine:cation symporter family protein [Bacteroidia bacterium]|nr:alanine/glycine:cation symporter family protein [Bacteroidia bacterium]